MKIKLFERLSGTSLGSNRYCRGLIIDGQELITSYEEVRTGDIEVCKHPDPWDSRVRQVLVNRVEAKPTHCPLATKIKKALESYKPKRKTK